MEACGVTVNTKIWTINRCRRGFTRVLVIADFSMDLKVVFSVQFSDRSRAIQPTRLCRTHVR